ncbi:hypothetical protein GQ600_8044 [Phytophthora cactorum]|nr:hypothetical protein GQ600_8044 [Phytophthora cactorum]
MNLRIVYQDTSTELEDLILTSATNALKALYRYKGEKTHFTEVAQQIKHEIERMSAWESHLVPLSRIKLISTDVVLLPRSDWLPRASAWLTQLHLCTIK